MIAHQHLTLLIVAAWLANVGTHAASKDEWGPPPPWERSATPEWAVVEGNSCPVKRIDLKTIDKLPSVPTFINNVLEDWPSFKAWQSKATFLAEFGQLSIKPLEDAHGALQRFMDAPEGEEQELRHFVENMQGKDALELGSSTAKDLNKAAGSWKYPRSRWKFQPEALLNIGGHGGSQPFRTHGSGWYGLIAGMKVWFLYPPEMPEEALDNIGIAPMKYWPERDYLRKLKPQYLEKGGGLRGRPMRCIQQPGEILWVPNYWWRSSYNLGETLSVGGESKIFTEDSVLAIKKYPDSSVVNHHVMQYLLGKGDASKAIEYGEKAVKNGPYNPQIALDYCKVLRKTGDDNGCEAILREYITKIKKLRSDELVMDGESEQALKLLKSELGSGAEDTDDAPHDEL
jgi:hypothetical protein